MDAPNVRTWVAPEQFRYSSASSNTNDPRVALVTASLSRDRLMALGLHGVQPADVARVMLALDVQPHTAIAKGLIKPGLFRGVSWTLLNEPQEVGSPAPVPAPASAAVPSAATPAVASAAPPTPVAATAVPVAAPSVASAVPATAVATPVATAVSTAAVASPVASTMSEDESFARALAMQMELEAEETRGEAVQRGRAQSAPTPTVPPLTLAAAAMPGHGAGPARAARPSKAVRKAHRARAKAQALADAEVAVALAASERAHARTGAGAGGNTAFAAGHQRQFMAAAAPPRAPAAATADFPPLAASVRDQAYIARAEAVARGRAIAALEAMGLVTNAATRATANRLLTEHGGSADTVAAIMSVKGYTQRTSKRERKARARAAREAEQRRRMEALGMAGAAASASA